MRVGGASRSAPYSMVSGLRDANISASSIQTCGKLASRGSSGVADLGDNAGGVVGDVEGAVWTGGDVQRRSEASGEGADFAVGRDAHDAFGKVHSRP